MSSTWLGVADHCLIGILEPREILAHVAAVERRRQRWASSRIEIGGVAVDTMLRIADLRRPFCRSRARNMRCSSS